MTAQVFLLPDLGEGLTDANVLEWKVAVGDTVMIDQLVVEVETAKASVEVPVPFAGTVLALHGEQFETLTVGSPLITIDSLDAGEKPSSSAETSRERHPTEEHVGSGNVLIGYGTSGAASDRRRRRAKPSPAAQISEQARTPSRIASQVVPVAAEASRSAPRVISPLVRNLARQHDVDLDLITPSDPTGIIRRADVEQVIADARVANRAVHPDRDPRPERIPLTGLRKTIADKLSASRREIPDATTWVDVDATLLLQARTSINGALPDDSRVSVLAILARLTVAALSRYPELNATVDTARDEIVRYPHIQLGIAAQTPRGLMVPVIADADTLSTTVLAQQLRETTLLAREGKLPPARLTGGTFTLNNYGVFGVDGSAAIINHPEAAILGVGRIIDRPWVVDGEITVRKMAQLSLSFDHRVCDGGIAGGFLRLIADYVENPVMALGGM